MFIIFRYKENKDMKLIQVSKKMGDSSRFNTHYLNINHIIDIYEWSNATVIVLSTGEKIECLEALTDILNKIGLASAE